jgi:hypothetical protein
MRFSVVRVTDLVLYIWLPLMIESVMITTTLMGTGSALVRVVGWNFFVLICVASALALHRRLNLLDVFHYRTNQKVLVGWTNGKYAVAKSDVETLIDKALSKLEVEYPTARQALTGCVILFRETSWFSLSTLRRVTGEQDGLLLMVGWKPSLKDTDLMHEIAHRVLEICADDPDEVESHRILERFNL